MGPVSPGKVTRMGLLMCVDAIQAFHLKRKGAISLVPTEVVNLSLAAHVRYDPDNMMIWMLIPSTMSANAQLKYFDYISKNELNPLSVTGIPGPDGLVRIKLFGASLDLKGKEKFYNQVILNILHLLFFATNTNLYLLFFATNTISSLFLATPGDGHGVLFMQHVSGPF